MTQDIETGRSGEIEALAAIYARAVSLAGDRLAAMARETEAEAFDRGARSVGALVRTAMQVNALQTRCEKDAAAHAKTAEPAALSEEALAAIRADIEAKLDALEARDRATPANHQKADDQCCA